jgi:hypothetical protein
LRRFFSWSKSVLLCMASASAFIEGVPSIRWF